MKTFPYALYLIVLAITTGCTDNKKTEERIWTAMGTYASVATAGDEIIKLNTYAEITTKTMEEMEARLSIFRSSSEINRINMNAGKGTVPISKETMDLLHLCQYYSEMSGGRFDVTIAPLMRLWGFIDKKTPTKEPSSDEIKHVLQNQIGWRNLFLTEDSACLLKTNMMIDLGGIAKGFAVDVCFHKLQSVGASNIMINLGGNLRCAGFTKNNQPWKIGVRNPFEKEKIIGTIMLTAGHAVATSGNYERFRIINGKRYAHIMNPLSGYPVEGMAGVTVIAPSAVEADALSTALFVAGIESAHEILVKCKDCYVIMIPDCQPLQIYLSEGTLGFFIPLPEYANSIKQLNL